MRTYSILTRVAMFLGALAFSIVTMATSAQADISRFAGRYTGSAEIVGVDGARTPRDMSVDIFTTSKGGFAVEWDSVSHRADGSRKTKSYQIEFRPADREGVYSAAMRRDVFGNAVQLDPMKGEPFVWARLAGDTLTVYSMTVDEGGGYDMQQFDRTLTEGGLDLRFHNIRKNPAASRLFSNASRRYLR